MKKTLTIISTIKNDSLEVLITRLQKMGLKPKQIDEIRSIGFTNIVSYSEGFETKLTVTLEQGASDGARASH